MAALTQPWAQTADRSVWAASAHGARLTVTRLSLDTWLPSVQWPGEEPGSGPVYRTRSQAQAWCEREARER